MFISKAKPILLRSGALVKQNCQANRVIAFQTAKTLSR